MQLLARMSAAALLCACMHPVVRGAELHETIDQHIAAGFKGVIDQPAGPASDAEFVRRVYLDLTGRTPSLEQTQAFLADDSPEKRTQLIHTLIDSAEFVRRLQQVFDVMWMERRGGNNVAQDEWEAYLYQSFAQRKPYDQLVSEILTADGTNPQTRGAAKFYLDRGGETDLLVRDVGRLFLGVDMQCAQCHDHPVIGDYSQYDYFGLYAYLNRSFVFTDTKKKKAFLAEKAFSPVTYMSVFDPDETKQKTGPHVPGGPVLEEPSFEEGKEYFVAPDKKNERMPIPKFSVRAQLGPDLTTSARRQMARNVVNRMWALLMGRGLVTPLDLHHSDNPASHPELLDELTTAFLSGGCDVHELVRQLALSQTYQRSSVLPDGMAADTVPEDRFAVAILKPLSPEQLVWSMLQATGSVDGPLKQARQAIDGDPRLKDIYAADAEREFQAKQRVEAAVYKALKGNEGTFVTTFGGAPGQLAEGFEATATEALFMANGNVVRNWSGSTARRSITLAGGMQELGAVADQLYLVVLSRPASDEERQDVVDFLETFPEDGRETALQEVAWALFASAEFRFNH